MYVVFKNCSENIVEEAPMNRVVRIILLAFIFTTTLSSCLVEKKDLVQIARTTDNLRVYQAGDSISYYATALVIPNSPVGVPDSQGGTLNINWLTPAQALIRPGTTDPILRVLKEVTILNINGSESGTVRYISQNDDGQITLHALEDSAGNKYWLSATGIAPVSATTTESFVTFVSEPNPLGIEFGVNPYAFYVMQGCEDAICDESVGQFNDAPDVVDDTVSVTTNLGVFSNPFQITFSGGSIPTVFPLPITFDIRDVCGNTGPLISHGTGTGGAGTMYVMPEIGMVRMENTCVNSDINGNTVFYTFTIRSTSFNPFL